MLPCRAINFTQVDCDFNQYRGRPETTGHYHSCPYLDEEDIELTSKDDYKVIKKEDKEVSLAEEPLSPIAKELFKKYKAPFTNINLKDGYHNLWVLPS